MSLAAWRHSVDPQVYARLEVDMSEALRYARAESQRTDVRIAPVHLVMRSVALALRRHADANAIVRWNRVYTRKRVHIFSQVAIPGKRPDLSGAILRDVDRKSPAEVARELQSKTAEIRRGVDEEFSRTRRTLDKTPALVYRPVLGLIDFLQFTLNFRLRFLGLAPDPFGAAMVTDVGTLGVSEALAPLVPRTRVALVVAVGKVEDRPVAREGNVVIRPMCTLGVTFDHRIMDGLLAAKLAKVVVRYLSDPGVYEK
jgi:pyruvate dehydrogenase E2 component (dihydrolipoamide acetyltransferase)